MTKESAGRRSNHRPDSTLPGTQIMKQFQLGYRKRT